MYVLEEKEEEQPGAKPCVVTSEAFMPDTEWELQSEHSVVQKSHDPHRRCDNGFHCKARVNA